MSYIVGLPNNSYTPITNTGRVRAGLCILQTWMHSIRSASDKVYQLLSHGQWFSDMAEILLKVALNTINQSLNQNI